MGISKFTNFSILEARRLQIGRRAHPIPQAPRRVRRRAHPSSWLAHDFPNESRIRLHRTRRTTTSALRPHALPLPVSPTPVAASGISPIVVYRTLFVIFWDGSITVFPLRLCNLSVPCFPICLRLHREFWAQVQRSQTWGH